MLTHPETRVPVDILPPKPSDICAQDHAKDVKACDNSFFKKACLVKAHVKYWVCKGAKRPKIGGDDDNFPGAGGDGYFGL